MKKIILVLFFINLYSFAQEKNFVLGKIETGHINFMGIKQKVFPF
ncbi:hypothetical protein [Flavobacterium psychrophilum]|nr:hypothetical protein [Flavobacterium psychrophilum]SNA71403.1 hypothetical protein DK095_240001 [Flavobacterium psychrophilum]